MRHHDDPRTADWAAVLTPTDIDLMHIDATYGEDQLAGVIEQIALGADPADTIDRFNQHQDALDMAEPDHAPVVHLHTDPSPGEVLSAA